MDPAVKKQYDIDTKYCLLCKKNETREECAWGPEMWDKYTTSKLDIGEGKKGLWDNIHARRKKGLPPKKPGEKGYPKTLNVEGVKSYNQFMTEVAAWQRKEGKNKEGGLNEKGRKSYERENPGSDLKAPSKKVGNPRRASFCARMKGMKAKLTSKKTASDPDSRINKSLRAWNC